MRKLFSVIAALLSGTILTLHCLGLATTKDFWGDEIYEVLDPLSTPPAQMFKDGVVGSPSKSPLYFFIQREAVASLLKSEFENQSGFDWRVSFRLVPAISLGMGLFLSVLILWQIHWLLGLATAGFFSSQNIVLWFGAESRVYASSLSLFLILFSITLLLFFENKTRLWIAWCVLCVLLPLTLLTSPAQVFSSAIILAIGFWYFRTLTKREILYLGIGLTLCVLVFRHYQDTMRPSPSLSKLMETWNWNHFLTEGLKPFEGPKNAIKTFLFSSILLLSGLYIKFFQYRKLYFATGLLGISQTVGLLLIYCLHYMSGYFYAPRHGLFVTASQALTSAALALLIVEIGLRSFQKFKIQITGAVLILALWDFAQWRIFTLHQAYTKVSHTYLPYCHGPVWMKHPPDRKLLTDAAFPVYEFNLLNISRHSGRCGGSGPAEEGGTYDFAPNWIYD